MFYIQCQKKQKEKYFRETKEENYISEIRYLKTLRLKQDSLDMDQK